jgi:simple sugar transport system permease protein
MEFIVYWLSATPSYAAPLLLAALGLIINEKAGVLNLGAEGMMACGALAGAIFSLTYSSPIIGAVAAVIAGASLAVLFGGLTVILRCDQVVSGLILVALGAGITGLLGRNIVGQTLPGFSDLDLGAVSDLPIVGPLIFSQNSLTYISFLFTVIVWWWMYRSVHGLRLRGVGESPSTADANGINVITTRFIAVVVGGAFCGLAGGYLALASSFVWVEGMIAGRGWIAIGLVIFARWNPRHAIVGALLFGAVEALIPRVQATGVDVPIYLMMMLPYLTTLGVLVIASNLDGKGSQAPASLGLPYARQDRH